MLRRHSHAWFVVEGESRARLAVQAVPVDFRPHRFLAIAQASAARLRVNEIFRLSPKRAFANDALWNIGRANDR